MQRLFTEEEKENILSSIEDLKSKIDETKQIDQLTKVERKTLINSLSNSGLMPKDLLEEMLNDLGIDLLSNIEVMEDYSDNSRNIIYLYP